MAFYWIDPQVLDRYGPELKAQGIAVYNALAKHADKTRRCWPSVRKIATLTGMSERSVQRALNRLVALGLIDIESRYTPWGDMDTNIYTLLPLAQPVEVVPAEPPHVDTANFPQAAVTLLQGYNVGLETLNGHIVTMAGWLLYAMTQKGLNNPVGYAFVQAVKGDKAPPAGCLEVVSLPMPWGDILTTFNKEQATISYTGYLSEAAPDWIEALSDEAWATLKGVVTV